MPELGKYAFEVLTSYGATLLLLCGLVAMSIRQARAARQSLAEAEAQAEAPGETGGEARNG